MHPFLLTRPKAQNARFAAALRERLGEGIRLIDQPLLKITHLDPVLPTVLTQNRAEVIFTSENAIDAWRRRPEDAGRVAWCVGERTARAAASAGFDARSAGGDAEALLALLVRERPAAPLVHIRGVHAAGSLADRLNSAGLETHELMVYDQVPVVLGAKAEALLKGREPVVVPLFSPRTAHLFAQEAKRIQAVAPIWVAAMSAAVARQLTGLPVARIEIAQAPDAEAMLNAVAKLCVACGQP